MPRTARHLARRHVKLAWRRFVASLSVAALLAGAVVAFGAAGAEAAGGSVTGTVFRDFNSNGAMDVAGGTGVAVDIGLAGVTATAYDRRNISVGSATTAANGTYSITVTAADSTDLRVEFTGLPAGYYTSFHGSAAAGNHSAEQFVQIGATNVNYAANAPEDFSQSNPPVITAIQHAGLANSATLATQPAIVAVPWTAGFSTSTGQGTTFPNRTTLATVPQVGSIWGTAYQGTTNSLYAAATYKRHSGLGPGGLAEIYRITGVLGANGAITTGTPTVTQWLNLQGKAIVGGGTMDLGTAASDASRGISTPTAPAQDLDGYQKAGKIGIGAMAISADQKTLYFINLFDKNLYSIDITNPVTAATSPVITKYALGLPAGQRPWAVELNRGYIYVGYVDTGEALATPTGAAAASLHAHVIRAAETAPTVWSSDLLNLDLGYTRGSPAGGGGANPVNPVNAARWNTWTDLWNWTGGSVATTWFGGGNIQVFPQPILSNLQFDNNGFVSLGFLDRASVQSGNRNHSTVVGDNNTYESLASGDLLVASQSPTTGVMTIENNAVVGSRTGTGSAAQGPGGTEFYSDQQGLGAGVIHQETTLGGLTGMGGVPEVVSSVYDPLAEIRVVGLDWLSTTNGAALRGYNLTPDGGGSASADGSFQKGGGLGDIEALSQSAPIQIGNRVWFDADQDGIQDADEPAIQGLTVNLLQGATVIATRTTDANGEYYFSSTDADLVGELLPDGGNYTVQFIKPTTGNVNIGTDTRFGTVAWADTSYTTTAVGANRGIDSNATPNVSDATKGEYVYTAGHVGVNDDTIDAGFIANGTLHVVKAIDASGGTSPVGATYAMTLAATDFRGNSLSVGADASFSVAVGAGNAHDVTMPVGSFATIAESADPTVKTVVISPTGAQKITGTGANRTTVTVTNTLFKPGTFSVAKTVSGEGAGLVASNATFTVEYTYPALAGTWVPMTVTRGGAAVTSAAIPYNTVVTVRETAPSTPSNVIWGTPSWTVGASTVTAATKTITIGDNTNVAITLDNPTTVQRSGFTVTKQVTGSAAGSVPNTFSFDVNYSYVDLVGATQTGTLHVTKGGVTQTASLANIPVGTSVTLSEVTPTGAAADVSWGTPTWSNNVTTNANGSATFVVGTSTVAVTLTNPTTQLTGGFSLQKLVTGSAAASVASSQSFVVTYTYPGQATPQTITVTKGSPNASVSGLPLGTVVTLSEATPTGAAADVQWNTPTWSNNVTTNGNGTATFTIGAAPVAVVLTNPTTQLTGGFSLAKVVSGSAAASVSNSQSFTVTYTYPGQATPQTLVVTKGSPNASVSGLPLGTVVTLSEATPTGAAADVQWNTPTWSNNVTTNGNGTATFTIGASPVAVVLTNPTTRLFSTLSVTKSVTGAAAAAVPGNYDFTVFYSYTDVAGTHSSSVTVSKNSPTASLGSIPLGSVVTLSEGPRTGAPAVVSWGTPTWSATGGALTDNGDGTASVTVSSTTSISIGLVNPTTQVLGGFNLSKVVNGSAAGSVSSSQTFSVTYTYPGQATPQTIVVTKGSPNASVGGIPLGTVVTLSEATPTGAPADVSWGTPTWSANVTTNGDGTASFTVGASPVAVVLTNPTTQLTGGFSLAKAVTGSAAGSVSNSQLFTVTYTYPGQATPQTLVVTKGSPNASVSGLPLGTVVTLSEATPTGAPADVQWNTPTWSNNVTTNGNGTATFTVGAAPVAIVLTNPTTQLTGGFSLHKTVSGSAAGSVSSSQSFTVTYTYPGQATPQTLVVTKGSPNASVSGLPLGTVVTLSEASPTGAPVDVSWGTPTWSNNVTTNADGTATFTVAASPVAVILTNPTTQLLGGFSLHKTITGSATGSVASSQPFTVTYTYPGQATPQTLVVTKGSPNASVSNVPLGTVVTVSEATPTGAPADVSWGTPTWSNNVTTNGDGTATFTVGAAPVAVTLTNPATQLLGGFDLAKVVSGAAAGSVASSQPFTVTYTYPGQATPQTLVVTKGSPTASVSNLPLGTVVTLSEATPTGAPGDVNWGTPTWSNNVTTNGDGTATFTVAATRVSVVLTNPTTRLFTTLELTKAVTGAATGDVPNSLDFTVDFSYTDFLGTHSQTATVSKASPNISLGSIPVGSIVTFSEEPVTGTPAVVAWQTPVWTVTGGGTITDNGDGSASLTINSTTHVAVGLENPTTQVLNGFSISKVITGAAAGAVANSQAFEVTYTYPGQATPQVLTVTKASPNASVSGLPLGTVVTLSEATPVGAAPVVSWGTPTWSSNVTTNADGTATFTVDAAPIAVTLTNPTTQVLSSFSLHKSVTGPAAGSVTASQPFTVTYTYPGQATPQTLTVTAGSPDATVGNLPVGTVVTLSEATPTGAPADVQWDDPTWSGNVTTNADGTATFTVDVTPVAVTLTNPTTQLTGDFSLHKTVTGSAAGSVASSQPFTVTYTYPGQATPQTITVTKGSPNASVTGLPLGTVVTLSEATPTGAPADVQWDAPTWSNNVTSNPDGTATFTVGTTPVAVTLTNPTTQLTGGFSLHKTVTGSAAGSVASSQAFTVTYTYPGQAAAQTISVTKGSPNATVNNLPVGTVVTLSEATPTGSAADVQWDAPTWSNNVTTNADGTATFTIGTTPVAVTLTNPTTQLLGGFDLSKVVTGAAAGSVASSQPFSVAYTYPGQAAPQTIVVTKGSPNASVTGLPLGTVVTLSEATPTGAPADVQWDTPTWSNNVTTNADGTATFTIGAAPVAVVLTNPTTQLFATLAVTKSVTGSAASSVQSGFLFTVFYSYTDALGTHASSVDVSKSAPTALLGAIPLGATVTLSEGARTGAPAVVAWGTPIWTASGGSITDNGDGTASVTVTSTTSIAIGLENPTTQNLGGFTLHKAVTGPAAASVAGTQDFTVTYTYPGQATPQSLVVWKGAPDAAVGNLPVGTVVTIGEAAPTGAPADVAWSTPTWSATGGSLTDNGDGTATFTIGTTAIALTLTNPTTQLTADLTLTKSVTGAAAGSVGNGFTFEVDYGWTDSAGAHSGTATVSKGSPTLALGAIPLGSVVTLSEVTPTGAAPNVNWQTPVWTATGASIVDNGDGTASVTVSASGTVAIGLENPTAQLTGGFSLAKVVSGSGAASVPNGTSFTVTYTYPGQVTPQTLVITKGSPNASVTGLPLGTVVTLVETAPSGVSTVSWGTPTWSSNVTTNADGSATFAVVATPVAVTLTNPATQLFGRFSITKAVTGVANGFVTPGFTFTGTYTYPGQATPGTFSLEAGQTWTSPAAEQIPAGTVVTITEDAPTGGIPAADSWMPPIFSIATVPFGSNGSGDVTVGGGTIVAVDLENPTVVSPTVTIQKGDGTGTTIDNEADTMPDAAYYAPGETKTIVFRVTNTGPEALRNVTLGDNTLAGSVVDALVWTFPDGSTTAATKSGNDWSATWPATFGPAPTLWAVGDVITGSATLTIAGSDDPHVDRARVDAVGATSALPVTASNDYNAYTAQIQIIHYDGNRPDPVVKDSAGNWITPTNPLIDADQDANDTSTAVKYPAGKPQQVKWVITNTGKTFLTHLTMSQLSSFGPQYADWTFDMTSIGGTQTAYNFITDGPWDGVFPPGASFFGSGPLTLDAQDTHEDTTQVVGAIVVPATNSNGVPLQLPTLAFGNPVFFKLPNGQPRIVLDSDPFNARAVPGLAFTGVDQGTISLAGWIGASGVLLGLVLLLLPKRRRRRTARS